MAKEMANSACGFCKGTRASTREIVHKVWTPANVSTGGATVVETIAVRCEHCDAVLPVSVSHSTAD
jgi:hypothetical protein